jgi:hypothetical protein
MFAFLDICFSRYCTSTTSLYLLRAFCSLAIKACMTTQSPSGINSRHRCQRCQLLLDRSWTGQGGLAALGPEQFYGLGSDLGGKQRISR